MPEYALEEMKNYPRCPLCLQPFETPTGFECDSCSTRVCGGCMRSYKGHYICRQCAETLPAKERELVGDAEELTRPLEKFARRSFWWWAVLLLMILPVMLGGAYLFYTQGLADYATGIIILMLALILYWNREAEKWI